MANEAIRFNEDLVSTGVAHFREEPIAPLREVHRVMRPGSVASTCEALRHSAKGTALEVAAQ